MATADSLITQVYAVLRDERREFVTEEMVLLWINEAQRDLASRIRELVTDEKVGTVGESAGTYYASDGTTDLAATRVLAPPDLTMVRSFIAAGVSVVFTDTDVFDPYQLADANPPAVLGRIFGMQTYSAAPGPALTGYERFIEVLGVDAGAAYTLRYTRAPVELTNPNDVVEVPVYLETKLVNYARAHAKWQEGEQVQGENYYMLYSENLPAPPRGHILTRPGPFTMTYEGNDFDIDGKHRG